MPTIPSIPADTDETVADGPVDVLDLRDLDALVESRHARRFNDEHIVDWLRSSGGTLAERIMKQAAADLIEGIRAPS